MSAIKRAAAATLSAACLVGAAAAHEHGQPAAPVDRAKLWQQILAKPSLAVSVAFDERGRLWLASVRDRHVHVRHSDDLGATFSPPVAVNAEAENILGDGENRPRLAVRKDTVFVAYTNGLAQPMTGEIRFSRSTDGGRTFAAPITVNDNREVISHRFVAMAVGDEGRIALVWLDKREQVAAQNAGRPYEADAVYSAESADGGESFLPNRKIADHSCECCRVALANDRDGTPVALWRHVFDGGIRDFAVARLHEPLRRASEDGWRIDACPHHGGDIAIDARGGRHIAWFTGAEGHAGLHYRRIDGERMTAPRPFGDPDAQAGHPAVLALGDEVLLAWSEYDGKRNRIRAMASADRGDTWSPPETLATTAGAADYPLLLADRGVAWLAWNTADEGLRLQRLQEPK